MSSDPLIQSRVGEFEIIESIGQGGMASVYRAHQPSMHRDVALKIIQLSGPPERDRVFSSRFQNEVRVISQLEHSHILPVYSYGVDDSRAYLAMRLMRGGTLEHLQNGEPLPVRKGVELFLQVAQALAHAHSRGIIHRDIKPSNVLMDDEGRVYLSDFGLAKLINTDATQTKSGAILGTPAYMSPEQLRGDPLDFRADVYALGCLLYEMLTGTPPFPPIDGDVIPVILKHLESPVPPPSSLNPGIPAAIEAVILKALEKNPHLRYPSVRDMAAEVAQVSGEKETLTLPSPASHIVNATRTGPLTPDTQAVNRPHPAWLATGIITIIAVVALVVLAFVLNSGRPSDFPPHVVELGETAPLTNILPDETQRIQAQSALGVNDFIAIIPCNTSSEYHAALTREMTLFARDAGLLTRVYDPDSDAYRQLVHVENAVSEGAKGIIICPLDIELLAPTLEQVNAAQIPVVGPTSGLGVYGGVQILTDNFLMGRKPGAWLGETYAAESDEPAQVVVLAFDDLLDVKIRADGLIDGFREFVPDAEIVARVRGATPEWSQESIQAVLDSGVAFNVILSINDAGAFGAITALEAAGITPDQVMIAGVDAELLARRYIREGNFLRVTVEVGRTVYAQAAVDTMILMLIGETLPEIVTIEPGDLITPETELESAGG